MMRAVGDFPWFGLLFGSSFVSVTEKASGLLKKIVPLFPISFLLELLDEQSRVILGDLGFT